PGSGCNVVFFQAEDGIRDDLVTGVQTCALPISLQRPDLLSTFTGCWTLAQLGALERINTRQAFQYVQSLERPEGGFLGGIWDERSEERRVGKECRLRGGEHDERKENDKESKEM